MLKKKKYLLLTIEDCNKAIFLQNDCYQAYYKKAKALYKLKKFQEALENLQQSCKLMKEQNKEISGFL